MERPFSITKGEFCAKLSHLKRVIHANGYDAIYLESEGAMRWLTGYRHQVVDIAPQARTTVQAVVQVAPEYNITFFSDPWEANRVHDILAAGIWNECNISAGYGGAEPDFSSPRLLSSQVDKRYAELERSIISVLAEGLEGNQWDKLQWLVAESRKTLIELSTRLTEGMTGWDLRTELYHAYHERHIELNLVMLGLSGMQNHLHPVVMDDSRVENESIVKLVIGARYFDMFHSASQLVKIGGAPTRREVTVHRALQEASLRYANQYRVGNDEAQLYESLGSIFAEVAKEYDLKGFEKSAYLHHAGGPLGPSGNRVFVVSRHGKRELIAHEQFAVNPVDTLEFLKFELQGVVLPEGAPALIDEFSWCPDERVYDTVPWHAESIRVPTILSSEGR